MPKVHIYAVGQRRGHIPVTDLSAFLKSGRRILVLDCGEMGVFDKNKNNNMENVGTEIKQGDRVRVSDHYAGYKHQYDFLYGTVFSERSRLKVRLEIPPEDIEQITETDLSCWGVIEKTNEEETFQTIIIYEKENNNEEDKPEDEAGGDEPQRIDPPAGTSPAQCQETES